MTARGGFPDFPPGFWRRIEVAASHGVLEAALEDDAHHFELTLTHADGRVVNVATKAPRTPWTTCGAAGDMLLDALVGERLEDVGGRDPAVHCTHLLDLAIVAAAHAARPGRHRYDMTVGDRVDGRSLARLRKDGDERLWWRLAGAEIVAPAAWAGRDIRRFAAWKRAIAPLHALDARMLRRAVFVSGVRRQADGAFGRASDRGAERLGACYTYQPEIAPHAEWRAGTRRDFSRGGAPLDGRDRREPARTVA